MSAVACDQHDQPDQPPTAEATLRYHGRSFHLASRVLPQRVRSRAARLYAFCRHVDDLADETQDRAQAERELQQLREDLIRRSPRSSQSADFLALAATADVPIGPAVTLIDTVSAELHGRLVASEGELIDYAYGVAGTVGLMMCAVLEASAPQARAHAVDLGIAMQLTNIARDVGEDAGLGRIYLPASWLGFMPPAAIQAPDPDQSAALRQATGRCLELAEHYYLSGLAGLRYLPTRSRYAIAVAAQVYRAIGTQVAAAAYRSWDRRAVVPVRSRLRLAAGALLQQAFKPPRASAQPLYLQPSAPKLSVASARDRSSACQPRPTSIS